jgi:hypothetical protein
MNLLSGINKLKFNMINVFPDEIQEKVREYAIMIKAKEKIIMDLKIGDLVEIEDYNREKIKGTIIFMFERVEEIAIRLDSQSEDVPALHIKRKDLNRVKILEKFNLETFLANNLVPKKFEIDEENYYIDKFFLTGSLRIKVEKSNEMLCPYFEKPYNEKTIERVLNDHIKNAKKLKEIFIKLGFYNF